MCVEVATTAVLRLPSARMQDRRAPSLEHQQLPGAHSLDISKACLRNVGEYYSPTVNYKPQSLLDSRSVTSS
jgi:hypothetical protein